jgi:hypothetical protein
MSVKDIIKNNLIECSKDEFTDKAFHHSYEYVYPDLLERFYDEPNNILEVGIYKGGGLKFLHDTFLKSNIFGIDNTLSNFKLDLNIFNRIKLLPEMEQDDINIELLPELDIIIEDASHEMTKSIKTFEILRPKLKKNGVYIIEDIYPWFVDLYKNIGYFQIIDVRHIKNRGDDVCAVYFNN